MRSKFFSILFLASFFFFTKVEAFSILPAKILLTSEKNNSELVQVRLINDENISNDFSVEVLAVSQNLDGTLDVFSDRELEKWIIVQEKNISLGAQEEKIIDFHLKIPQDLYPGSHFYALAVSKVSSKNLKTQLVSLLNLEIAGTAVEQMKIQKFTKDKKIYFNKNLNFSLSLKNISNVAVAMKGDLKIRNIFSKEVFKKDLAITNKLLVNSVRNLNIEINNKENKIFWPGIYKAELNIFYGKTGQIISDSTTFVYLPIWFFVALSFFLALLGLIYKKRKYEK